MAGSEKKRAAKAQSKIRRKSKSTFGKLDKALETALNDYFGMLEGHNTGRLHKLVFDRVEKKLLEYVLKFAEFNQSRAAAVLGLSRSTLRSKIRAHGLTAKKTKPRAAKKR